MWPFDEIRWHFDDKRRIGHIRAIIKSAQDRHLHLSPYIGPADPHDEWHSSLEKSVWFHPFVEKVTYQRDVTPRHYSVEFLTQRLTPADSSTHPKYTPASPLPNGYFDEPIGQVPNPDYARLNGIFTTSYDRTRSAIVSEDEKERNGRSIRAQAELDTLTRQYLPDEVCSTCHGDREIRRAPARVRCHPVSGFPAWDDYYTSDEEEVEQCPDCMGSGSMPNKRLLNLKYELEGLKRPSILLDNRIHIEWAKKGIKKPAENFPVHIKVVFRK